MSESIIPVFVKMYCGREVYPDRNAVKRRGARVAMNNFHPKITGHLDIIVTQQEDESDGGQLCWNEVLIHGDPKG